MSKLIIVSNRLPITLEGGDIRLSDGGVVATLNAYLSRYNGDYIWVGAGDAKIANDKIKPVEISSELYENYYNGFHNQIIWPLFHGFPQYIDFANPTVDLKNWEAYQEVNKLFTDKILELAQPDDLIWIHDVHLMLVPSLLHQRFPYLRVGFFCHIPWPSWRQLSSYHWSNQIVKSLCQADLVGFHTAEYTTNFFEYLKEHDLIERSLGTFPVGIDFDAWEARSKRSKQSITNEPSNIKTILLVARLDYTKGFIEALEGFRDFLERFPSWNNHCQLRIVAIPTREDVAIYKRYRQKVYDLIDDINKEYLTKDWTPILYQYRSIDCDKLASLYKSADVMLVSSLKDGMNLVCKEYVACKNQNEGALILSCEAGAAEELKDAITINPTDRRSVSQAISHALNPSYWGDGKRMGAMRQKIKEWTAFDWGDCFLQSLRRTY